MKLTACIAAVFRTTIRCFRSRLASVLVLICCVSVLLNLFHAAGNGDSLRVVEENLLIQSQTESTKRRSQDEDPCRDMRRPQPELVRTNGQWQIQDTGDDKLVLYSAFYDDRPTVDIGPWIRIIGVAKLAGRTHYCHVWYPGANEPNVTTVVVNIMGRTRGYKIQNSTYIQYLLSCRLAGADPVPSHVSIVADRCSTSTVYLPVERPVRVEPDIEFGVCVAIAFGNIPVPVFVEWIELTWMLGVREFNVYDAGMVNMSQVFNHYTRRGWLKVHHMPPPVPAQKYMNQPINSTEREMRQVAALEAVKLASPASLNDCMMRNVYRYRYVVVIDFDEFIIPRSHDNYTQLVQHLSIKYKPDNQPHTFMFHNTYFFLDLPPDPQQPEHMRTASLLRRVPPSTLKISPKSFVDPRTCLAVFNHFCLLSLLTKNTSRQLTVVSTDLARCHHYRKCSFDPDVCLRYFSQDTFDNTTLRFKSHLQPIVEATIAKLNRRQDFTSTRILPVQTTSSHLIRV